MAVLAGRPRQELVRSLQAFRDGTREATIMHHIARGYSDIQTESLAGYFAGLKR